MINFEQPDLALTYVVVLSSRIPKILILVFYHLLLMHFCPLEAMAKNSKNAMPFWKDFKNSFARLTGMKKLTFYFNNFFDSGHFSIHEIWKKDQKMTGVKKVIIMKNYFFHTRQPHERIFKIPWHRRYIFTLFGQSF